MSVAVGISLGSESCVVAVSNPSTVRCEVVANDAGDRITPTYASLVGAEWHYGSGAKNSWVRHPMQTVPYLLPLSTSELASDPAFRVACEIDVREADDRVVVTSLDPDDPESLHDTSALLAQFMARVKSSVVDGACGSSGANAVVLAVPRYVQLEPFTSLLEQAGYSGHMQVVRSDIAALLAYPQCIPKTVPAAGPLASAAALVVDWGAKALVVSVVALTGGVANLLAHRYSFGAGSALIDKELQQHVAAAFAKRYRMDPQLPARAMRKLLLTLDDRKKILSTSATTSVEIEAFAEGVDLKEPLSSVKLESLVRDTLELPARFDALLDEVLEELAASDDDQHRHRIRPVVLVGGALRMPMLSRHVKASVSRAAAPGSKHAQHFFDSVEFLDTIAPDEVTAVGAATQALVLCSGGVGKRAGGASGSSPTRAEPPAAISAPMARDAAPHVVHSLGHDLYLLASDKRLQKSAAAGGTAEVTVPFDDLVLLFPKGTPLPIDSAVEIPDTADPPRVVLLCVQGPVDSTAAASTGSVSVKPALQDVVVAGIPTHCTKVTFILFESRGSLKLHVLAETAEGKKQHVTKAGALEVGVASLAE